MLVFEYRKAPFSAEAEQALDAGIKKIAAKPQQMITKSQVATARKERVKLLPLLFKQAN